MRNVYKFEDLKQGKRLVAFTACGIFDGIVAENREAANNGWMMLSDVKLIPINSFHDETQIVHINETLISYDQIIALTSGLSFE